MSDPYHQPGFPGPSISPDQSQAYHSQSSPDAPMSDQADPNRRSSALNLGFLKDLTSKRSTRGTLPLPLALARRLDTNCDGVKTDGTQPKKRGPKPDSKPALTRRQELNRQAQRYGRPSNSRMIERT